MVVTGDPDEVPPLLETHRPDLVLLDLLLPGTDGSELMRGLPTLADRPVIFLLAYGRDETIAGGRGGRSRRLRRQSVLAHGTLRAGPDGPAQAGRAGQALPDGGTRHPPPRTPGDPSRQAGAADSHGVRSPERARGQYGPGVDPRLPATLRIALPARRKPPGSCAYTSRDSATSSATTPATPPTSSPTPPSATGMPRPDDS